MNVVFTIDFAGAPDQEDMLAARHAIFLENQRRAQLTPPGVALPFGNAAQTKSSYLTVLTDNANSKHRDYAAAATNEAGMAKRFTPAQVTQMNANLVARLNAGESAASIVTDTATL